MQIELKYLDIMRDLLAYGEKKDDRTGTGVYSLFSRSISHDMREGFPLLTTKKIHTRSVFWEMMWFLNGCKEGNSWLNDRGVTIWDEWADPTGYLGPIYGKQWRDWVEYGGYIGADGDVIPIKLEGTDQIDHLIEELKDNPNSMRHIVSSWNVAELPMMALPPCHMMFQCYVSDSRFLDLQMYQRSADWFLGVPFNIASYALLMILLGKHTDLEPRNLHIVFGDLHLYVNHTEQANKQLARKPFGSPRLTIPVTRENIEDYNPDTDFILEGYSPYPAIPAPISV